MLTEILAERKKEKERLDNQAKLGMGLGLALRYAWNALLWAALMVAVGVALVVYTTFKVLFGSMGK